MGTLEERKAQREDDKIPYDANTGQRAESDNPETWTAFARAMAVFEANPKEYSGLGIEFGGVPQLVGIDLDGMGTGWCP